MARKFLSLASVKRLFKKLGGRVGSSGYLKFEGDVEDYAEIIAKLAIRNALYEGRKAVKEKDIKEAIKEIEEK